MRYLADRICKNCGVTFAGGPRAWYCPTCRNERAKESNREHKRRKRLGKSRKVGDSQICVDCGCKYAYYIGASERCPKCAEMHGKTADRQKSKEWNKANRDKYLEAKREHEGRKRASAGSVKTGEKYIYFDRGKYRVIVKGAHIGYFADLESAVIARDSQLKND